MSTPVAYWVAVSLGAVGCAVLCAEARGRPGSWVRYAGRVISTALAVDAVVFVVAPWVNGDWTVRSSLPLALCDVALVVAAIACWRPETDLAVELTYYWGLAGTLQAILTPDLSVGFPHLEFFEYVVGHVGIVVAALFLVVGTGRRPRRGAVPRVFLITAAYTACVGGFDWLTGSNYMFLAAVPAHTSLLSWLGPWPWYVVSAAGVAIVLLLILDAPFRHPTWLRHPHPRGS